MRILLIFSIFAALISCSSYQGEQREEQQQDTFDRPVGSEEGVYMSPYENQPR